MTDEVVKRYWAAYLKTLPADHAHHTATYDAWGFGDSPQMADELGALVQAGAKTATASLGWSYEAESEPLPQVGALSIILDGGGTPLCIVEITEVRQVPFNAVGAQFAYDEGEGDRSLAYWRDAHHTFFTRECARIGRTFSEDAMVVCERFRVVRS